MTLRRGKTDQEGRGRLVAIPKGSDRCCPVRAVCQWLKVAEIDAGPPFRSIRKGGTVAPYRLSSDAVSILVKRHIERIGLDPTRYSGHSLRAGFVTTAARAGIASHVIRQQTGHASEATMQRYIRQFGLFRDNAAGQLLGGPN
jgi:integrase